jgi:hypothetical protein
MTNERMVNRQATLHIERPSRRFRDAKRSYRVLVDREVRGRVREGDVLTLTVAPGAHTVQARLDWTGSVEHAVDLEPGSTTTLIVAPAGQTFDLWRLLSSNQWIAVSRKGEPAHHMAQQSGAKPWVFLVIALVTVLMLITFLAR